MAFKSIEQQNEDFSKTLQEILFEPSKNAPLSNIIIELIDSLNDFGNICKFTLKGRVLSSISTKTHLKAMIKSAKELSDILSETEMGAKNGASPITYDDLYTVFRGLNAFAYELNRAANSQHSNLLKGTVVNEKLSNLVEEVKECKYTLVGLANENNAKIYLEQIKNWKENTPKKFNFSKPIPFYKLNKTVRVNPKESLEHIDATCFNTADLEKNVRPYLDTTLYYVNDTQLYSNIHSETEELLKNKPSSNTSGTCDEGKKTSSLGAIPDNDISIMLQKTSFEPVKSDGLTSFLNRLSGNLKKLVDLPVLPKVYRREQDKLGIGRFLRIPCKSAKELSGILSDANTKMTTKSDDSPITYDDLYTVFRGLNAFAYELNRAANSQDLNPLKGTGVKEKLSNLAEEVKECKYMLVGLANANNAEILLGKLKDMSKSTSLDNLDFKKPITFYKLNRTGKIYPTEKLPYASISSLSDVVLNIISNHLETTMAYGDTGHLVTKISDKANKLLLENKPSSNLVACSKCGEKKFSNGDLFVLDCGHNICQKCAKNIEIPWKGQYVDCPKCYRSSRLSTALRTFINFSGNTKTDEIKRSELSKQEKFYAELRKIDLPQVPYRVGKLEGEFTFETWLNEIRPAVEEILKLCNNTKDVAEGRKDTLYYLNDIAGYADAALNIIKKLKDPSDEKSCPTKYFQDMSRALYRLAESLVEVSEANFHDLIHQSVLNYIKTRIFWKSLADRIHIYRNSICILAFEGQCKHISDALEPIKKEGIGGLKGKKISYCLFYPQKKFFGLEEYDFKIDPIKNSPKDIFSKIKKLSKLIDKCPYRLSKMMLKALANLLDILEKIINDANISNELFKCDVCKKEFSLDNLLRIPGFSRYFCKKCVKENIEKTEDNMFVIDGPRIVTTFEEEDLDDKWKQLIDKALKK